MKGLQFWAKKHSDSYQSEEKRSQEVAYTSFVDGFRAGREHAAKMMENLGNNGAGILIRAIGQAEVDPETGKPLALD